MTRMGETSNCDLLSFISGALNVRIDEQSKRQFREQNGITHRRRTMEAVAGDDVCSTFQCFPSTFFIRTSRNRLSLKYS